MRKEEQRKQGAGSTTINEENSGCENEKESENVVNEKQDERTNVEKNANGEKVSEIETGNDVKRGGKKPKSKQNERKEPTPCGVCGENVNRYISVFCHGCKM